MEEKLEEELEGALNNLEQVEDDLEAEKKRHGQTKVKLKLAELECEGVRSI